MPFCPKCNAEYFEGVRMCADCGVELVRDLLPKPDFSQEKTTVVFEAFAQDYLIGMIKGLLETNGIKCLVFDEIGTDCLGGFQTPKRISVLEKDAPRAKEIIDVYLQEVEVEKK